MPRRANGAAAAEAPRSGIFGGGVLDALLSRWEEFAEQLGGRIIMEGHGGFSRFSDKGGDEDITGLQERLNRCREW